MVREEAAGRIGSNSTPLRRSLPRTGRDVGRVPASASAAATASTAATTAATLGLVISKMAPLDLDKYVEIARLCKYLPENDLKVSLVGAGALPVGFAPSGCEVPPARPSSLRGIHSPGISSGPGRGPDASRSLPVRLGIKPRWAESPISLPPPPPSRDPRGRRGRCPRVAAPGLGLGAQQLCWGVPSLPFASPVSPSPEPSPDGRCRGCGRGSRAAGAARLDRR